jgi:hypothetical protein
MSHPLSVLPGPTAKLQSQNRGEKYENTREKRLTRRARKLDLALFTHLITVLVIRDERGAHAPFSFPALWHAVRESDSTGNFHFNAGDERRGKCFLISAFLIDADQQTNKHSSGETHFCSLACTASACPMSLPKAYIFANTCNFLLE